MSTGIIGKKDSTQLRERAYMIFHGLAATANVTPTRADLENELNQEFLPFHSSIIILLLMSNVC